MAAARTRNVVVDESHQDLAEYALLIGLVEVVVIGVVAALGGGLVGFFNNIVATPRFGG
ncbi:MAG: Flp family type IVb pilin [Gemmatimonadetes bacterium]|nr:Flp family type IVb pilin [Gemmatimonadota bacterium]